MLSIQYGLATDVGKIRSENQDGVFAIASHIDGEHGQSSVGLFVVLDGMGGQGKGVEATYLAIEAIKAHLIPFLFTSSVEQTFETIQAEIRQALEKANSAISHANLNGAGCSVTLAIVIGQNVYVGHYGITIAYTVIEENIVQITTQYPIVNKLIELEQLTVEESYSHPIRILYRYKPLGLSDSLESDIFARYLSGEQTLLLCSDGLTRHIKNPEIQNIILQHKDDPQTACNRLVELANERGGEDNIAVILVKVSD